MNVLLRASGEQSDTFLGNYFFGDGTLYIPQVDTLPSEDVPDGTIFHVASSGVLAIHHHTGGRYAIITLEVLP